MRRTLLLLLLVITTTPLLAQSNTVTLFATSQHNGGSSSFPGDPGENLTIEFDTGTGFGASYARALRGRWSVEGALFRTKSDVDIRAGALGSQNVGDVTLTSFTGMLRAHSQSAGAFNAYAGAGVGYAMPSDIADVSVDNELTLAVGAGVTWDFSPRAGLVLDARYLPLTLKGNVDGEAAEADMNPLLVSAGLRLRF